VAFLGAAPTGKVLSSEFSQAQQQMFLGENPLGIPAENLRPIPMQANPERVAPFGLAVDSNRAGRAIPAGISEVYDPRHTDLSVSGKTEEGVPHEGSAVLEPVSLLGAGPLLGPRNFI
jgi:hypothetical protein